MKTLTIRAGKKRTDNRSLIKLAHNTLYYKCRFLDPMKDREDNIHKLPGLINGLIPRWSSNRPGFNWDPHLNQYKLIHYVYSCGKREYYGYYEDFYQVEINQWFYVLLFNEDGRFLMFLSLRPFSSYNIDTLEKIKCFHEFRNFGLKSPITFQSHFFIEPPEQKDLRVEIEYFDAKKFKRFGLSII